MESSTSQPNQILINKPTCIRLIIPEEVVMQPRLTVGILVQLHTCAKGVVTVVFVARHQSVGLAVFDHDVVSVGEIAQLFAVASVNGSERLNC